MRPDEWEPVTLGKSGADVRRSPDGQHFAKVVARIADHAETTGLVAGSAAELVAERARMEWLATTPIVAPRVVDWEVTDRSVTLVTTALPGIPASAVPAARTDRATRSLAAFLRDLHSLDPIGCPFDRSLAVAVALARANVTAGLVDEDDFDATRRGRTAADLLAELARRVATRTEREDLVVCHGDASLPNLHLDPDTLAVVGILDVGRLGVADRYQDLAILTRSMSSARLNPGYGARRARRLFAAYGIHDPDPEAIDLYRLLDEFF